MQARLGKCNIGPDNFDEALATLFLVIIDGCSIAKRLGRGRDQWDDRLEALTKLCGVRDSNEYKRFDFLGKPLTTIKCLRKIISVRTRDTHRISPCMLSKSRLGLGLGTKSPKNLSSALGS